MSMSEPIESYSPAMPLPPLALPDSSYVTGEMPMPLGHATPPVRPLHRLGEVRKAQGISIANVSRRLDMASIDVREQEKPTADMLLTQLYKWRDILDVPVSELLINPDDTLDDPIKSRASLVRVMKTVRSILETSREKQVKWLAQTLFDQLVEIMPELKEVSAWPSVGQSREFKDYGQAIYRRFDPGIEQAMID